jgi:predicted transcriptional regulator
MTTTRQRIHHFIFEHPNSTITEIAKSLGVSRSCVSPQVSNLHKEGLVTRTGNHGEYRFSSGPVTEHVEKPVLHMSEGMCLFNKLLRGVRAS